MVLGKNCFYVNLVATKFRLNLALEFRRPNKVPKAF